MDFSGTSWEVSKGDQAGIPVDVEVDSSKLPLVTENEEQFLRMYWIDAYEDQYKQPGTQPNYFLNRDVIGGLVSYELIQKLNTFSTRDCNSVIYSHKNCNGTKKGLKPQWLPMSVLFDWFRMGQ